MEEAGPAPGSPAALLGSPLLSSPSFLRLLSSLLFPSCSCFLLSLPLPSSFFFFFQKRAGGSLDMQLHRTG